VKLDKYYDPLQESPKEKSLTSPKIFMLISPEWEKKCSLEPSKMQEVNNAIRVVFALDW
jgi:hypothetical protein